MINLEDYKAVLIRSLDAIQFTLAFFLLASLLQPASGHAGIVAAGLGTRVNETGSDQSVITGGTIKGKNQFHRFSAFGLSGGESARFEKPQDAVVANLINLVSGDEASVIDGDIDTSSYGEVNFFLLNPQGIVLGQNASLNGQSSVDVAASFHFSTADSIKLGDDRVPVDAKSSDLLSADPLAFGFSPLATSPLVVESSVYGLQVRNGDLELTAPSIEIKGAMVDVTGGDIYASTRVNGRREAPLRQQIPADGAEDMGNISISGGALIIPLADDGHGGSVFLSGKDVTLGLDRPDSQGSLVFISSESNTGATINISASQSVRLLARDQLFGSKTNFDVQKIPLITVRDFKLLEVNGGSEIATRATDTGRAGHIELEGSANARIMVTGERSQIDASASGGSSIAGNITVKAASVTVRDGGRIRATTSGNSDQLKLKSGDITIIAREIDLADGKIINQNSGTGAGGKVLIEDNDLLMISGEDGGVFSRTFGEGAGGEIEIHSNSVAIANGGRITASSLGSGVSGNITISDNRQLSVSGEASVIGVDTIGSDAGNINITSRGVVHLGDGGAITTSSKRGEGDGGAIYITGTGKRNLLVLTDDSKITANTAAGTGGNIFIKMQSVLRPMGGENNIQAKAKTAQGVDGVVEFQTPDVDATTGIVQLPENFLDASALLNNRCVSQASHASSLHIGNRQGVGASPDALLGGYGAIRSEKRVEIADLRIPRQNLGGSLCSNQR